MKNTRKKFALVLSLVMAVSMSMTACGDSDKDDDDEDETPTYEVPVENFFKSVKTGSGSDLKKCFEKNMVSEIEESWGEEYFDSMAKGFKEDFEDEFGESAKVSYKVTKKESMDEEKLDDCVDRYKNSYDAEVNVTSGYELDIELVIKGGDASSYDDDDTEMTFEVVKADGKWVLYDMK